MSTATIGDVTTTRATLARSISFSRDLSSAEPYSLQFTVMAAFWLKVAAVSGASAVLLGAFGAHGLKNRAGMDATQLKTWETAAHYHLVHSAALLFAAYTRSRPAAMLFTAGEGGEACEAAKVSQRHRWATTLTRDVCTFTHPRRYLVV